MENDRKSFSFREISQDEWGGCPSDSKFFSDVLFLLKQVRLLSKFAKSDLMETSIKNLKLILEKKKIILTDQQEDELDQLAKRGVINTAKSKLDSIQVQSLKGNVEIMIKTFILYCKQNNISLSQIPTSATELSKLQKRGFRSEAEKYLKEALGPFRDIETYAGYFQEQASTFMRKAGVLT